jgi:hypothetical protein
MTINKEKFEVMDIDDVFIIQDIEEPNQIPSNMLLCKRKEPR